MDGDSVRQTPLAIVGMACRLPGADDLDQYWEMLIQGRCAVSELPPERFDTETYYAPQRGLRDKTYTRRGAIVAHRPFDFARYPIAPDLVRSADPTHLLMCQTAADALRHAGLDPLNVPLRNTGVYVGHTIGSDLDGDRDCAAGVEETAQCLRAIPGFRALPANEQEAVLQAFVARVRRRFPQPENDDRDLASHMAAGIVAKAFGLNGPFLAVNAACASSLQALLLAARALQRGQIDMAIVGGAAVCSAEWLVLFSAAQSMSVEQSRPFAAQADGLIVAEGYAAIVVKTLARAVADSDAIQAVIHGIGAASDGRGRSLWAPRKEGQIAAIRRAYASPQEIADLQYIEAHATATQLGDATEVASLSAVLGDVFPPGKKIPITSVKANIGHALEAAGLASVVKTVLCMQKGFIPPAVNIDQPNPSIDWANAPVELVRTATPWPAPAPGKPRRAGVNAFGIGGLNIHVALDAYDAAGQTLPAGNGKPQTPRSDADDAVAIIGCGCVFPGALNVAAFQEMLQLGGDAGTPIPTVQHVSGNGRAANDSAPCGGYVHGFSYDWRRHKIPPKQIALADPLQFMTLEAADQALRDAGYDRKPLDRRRTGIVVGTEFCGDFTFRLHTALRLPYLAHILRDVLVEQHHSPQDAMDMAAAFTAAFHEKWPVLADESGSFSASSLAVRIAKTYDLQGGAAAVDAGAASGGAALAAAVDLLLAGDCDLLLCGAAQRDLLRGACGAATHTDAIREYASSPGPFDRNAAGGVPSEGVGMFLLKRLKDAQRDGDSIQAIIRGVGAAHGPLPYALPWTIDRAQHNARCSPGDIAMAMTDARGAPAADEQIVRGVAASQAAVNRADSLCLGSVVGRFGHTGGASAGASLLAAVLALKSRTSPPVFGIQTPSAAVLRAQQHVHVANRAEPLPPAVHGGGPIAAVVSQDKGLTYSIVLEGPAEIAASSPPQTERAQPQEVAPPTLANGKPLIAHRSVLRLVDAPLSAGDNNVFVPLGAVLIVGDGAAAVALGQRLEAGGAAVHRLKPSQGIDAALADMEGFSADLPIRTVFLMTGLEAGRDAMRDAETWRNRRQHGIELPHLVLQKWRQQLERVQMVEPCVVAAATMLGGGLGLDGRVVAPEGGWLTGLLKSLEIEWNRYERPTLVKICDFGPDDAPDTVVDALLCELAVSDSEIEAAWGGGRRRMVQTLPLPAANLPRRDLQHGATWILTGGARGITAEVAARLGQAYGLNLHLLGRSPVPRDDAPWRNCSDAELKQIKRGIVREAIAARKSPEKQWERVKNDIEIFNNLERMRKLGLSVAYHSCDVADWAALACVLQDIRATAGPITGIVHGAGYARSSRFEGQKRPDLTATLNAKVEGAVALMTLTREDPVAYFVGFGSISGRFGGNGLSDYAAANDMLAKLCAWHRAQRVDCATTCIDWQSWDEVGMAMLPDSAIGARDVLKMKFISPAEGVQHLVDELCTGLSEAEVLMDDGEFKFLVRPSTAGSRAPSHVQ